MFAEALVCLALNVYHEARDQPFIGQVAVARGDDRVHDDNIPMTCVRWSCRPDILMEAHFPIRRISF